jgi:C1A family cysteine protease
MSQDELMELRQAIRAQGHTWQAGPTSLSALPLAQQSLRLGLRLERAEMARIIVMMAEPPPRAAEFPPAWDWRNVDGADWTTPIQDQGACGSCVAFGTVAVLESMSKLHHNDASLQPDLSEAHLFFCGCGACCDQGWWPSHALDYAQSSGVPDEVCFPYQDRNLPCSGSCDDWPSRAVKVVSWQEIIDGGARKEWLATRGPMIGCMAVYRDLFSYTSGIYRHTTGDLAGYHAVCVVGYSEVEQAWICKNSWGPDWGESGWFKMAYGECGMDTQFAMYGIQDITPPSPQPEPKPEPEPEPAPGCNLWAQIVAAIRRWRQ